MNAAPLTKYEFMRLNLGREVYFKKGNIVARGNVVEEPKLIEEDKRSLWQVKIRVTYTPDKNNQPESDLVTASEGQIYWNDPR